MKTEKLGQKKDKEVTRTLHLAQLEDLENPRPIRRNKDQRTDRPKGRGMSRGAIERECLYCESKEHWLGDCPVRNEKSDEADGWELAPSRKVTVNHPKGGGGGGHSH